MSNRLQAEDPRGPDGWPKNPQYAPVEEPSEIDLGAWEDIARQVAGELQPGSWNWPRMVRSLVVEVRALRARVEQLEANATEDYDRRDTEGGES